MTAAGKDNPWPPPPAERPAGPRARSPLPPSLDGATLVRIPVPNRQEAAQEAWVAYLFGQDPNVAVWAYLKRVRRHARRWVCFSQMTAEQSREVFGEEPGEEKNENWPD